MTSLLEHLLGHFDRGFHLDHREPFEATVKVEIRQDGTVTPLAADIVMGGANGQMGSFSKAVPSPKPTARRGAIVLKTLSSVEGSVNESAVLRVGYA